MRHKASLFTGISLFLSFCILSTANYLYSRLPHATLVILILETAAFIFPSLFLNRLLGRDFLDFRFRMPKQPVKMVAFTVFGALAVSLLTFLIYVLLLRLTGYNFIQIPVSIVEAAVPRGLCGFVAATVFSAVAEEFYFRGAVFSSCEKAAGSWMCIFINGLIFGMMHTSVILMVSCILCGAFYAWLTYAFQSIVPAILAHFIQNAVFFILRGLTDAYGVYGIWEYLPFAALIFFFLFAWLAFRQAERLSDRKAFFPFQKNRNVSLASFFEIALTPGFVAFTLAFLLKSVWKVI